MKTKLLALLMAGIFSFNFSAKADEGMWLPFLVSQNYAQMKALGLKLTPEQLYSVNNSSLKDAIVMLDYGSCTGEIISDQGLLLTNHHCGYGEIQNHSTEEHDYLTDGFWALKKSDELPNRGKTASFLVRIEDVTKKVLKGVKEGVSYEEAQKIIGENIEKIEKKASEDGVYDPMVKRMFEGSEYYLYVYQTFRDVRLVGAPPSSIGKFGGDTDNWMWPRHTGDFTLFRVYGDKDGNPADYSEDNVPIKPKHHLPVSLKGYEENDFAMIWGFPGTTDRYRTSYGIQLTIDQLDPIGELARRTKMDAAKPYMDAKDGVRIMYADSYAGWGNFWKKAREERKALIALDVYGQKKQLEDDFSKWVQSDKERIKKYGKALKEIEAAYKEISDKKLDYMSTLTVEVITGPGAFLAAFRSSRLLNQYFDAKAKGEDEKAEQLGTHIKERLPSLFDETTPVVEKALMVAMLDLFYKNAPEEYHPKELTAIAKKYKGDWKKFVEKAYAKSIYGSVEQFNEFAAKPSKKKLEKDMLYNFCNAFVNLYFNLGDMSADAHQKLSENRRLFIAGLREMNPGTPYYPDANSSMRVTYGKVLDYDPRDGVHYKHITYLDGVIEKDDPTSREFDVDEKLKELYEAKDYGMYGVDGRMPVCFLTDNDITGGNSGSPVINANGELIGTAFDGNSEAMSSDLEFDPNLQRTIVCDIRYVLFVIDKFAGATNLIEEMTIVK